MKRLLPCILCAALALTGCAAPAGQSGVQPAADAAALEAQLEAVSGELEALQQELEALREAQQSAPQEAAASAQAPAAQETPAAAPQATPAPAQSATQAATGQKTMADYDLDTLRADTAAVVAEANAASPGADANANYETFRSLNRALSEMEDRLDRCEDEAEADFRQGLLSRTELKALERELDALDDDLDDAEDSLEYRFGYDD